MEEQSEKDQREWQKNMTGDEAGQKGNDWVVQGFIYFK